MNKRFMQIITAVTNYEECEYRSGGGSCKATSIGKCKKKCKFISPHVSLSNYQEKAVKAFDLLQEKFTDLLSKYVQLNKKCENTKAQYEHMKSDCERMTAECAELSQNVEELIALLLEAGIIEVGEEDGKTESEGK